MPKPEPLPPDLRQRVADDIRAGHGRNTTARRHGISTGSVSNIAHAEGLTFPNPHPAQATHAARIDAALARIRKEQALITQQGLALAHGRHRTARRIEQRINDTNRFHKPLNL